MDHRRRVTKITQRHRALLGTAHYRDAGGGGVPRFGYAKADRRVTAYYFYLVDEVFGPAFVKVCAYFPYPVKMCLLTELWAGLLHVTGPIPVCITVAVSRWVVVCVG